MSIPYSLYEQMRHNWFEPDHKLALIFGVSKYDNVLKRAKEGSGKKRVLGGFEQVFPDLPTVNSDCKLLKQCAR